MSEEPELLADAEAIVRSARRMAASIVEEAMRTGAKSPERLAIVGIRRGGVPVAALLASEIAGAEDFAVPTGTIDIALYRDDAATALPDPKIGPSAIDFDVSGRDVVLVDDVLQTGRTVRAAIDCLLDYGRPRRIWLAVLFDRGGRELPIAADFVGRPVEIEETAKLEVFWDDAGAPLAARVSAAKVTPR
ncbi:MAG: bifunctional pyr operon transcriptional regulator/uracil phosphoribosyltransferase PyrR [Myxococcota bacterium]|nr:bifunctional pyr operon transcriptional regulator/uracil phosphoribosyltransferase PyrR [Myxococcota bacterium]